MGLDPVNPIVGGTILRIPAIQSPDFVTGVSGWIIRIDGSAEFNNLVIRGEFSGTDFIIDAAGIFFYSGTPAAGNLIVAIAQAAGTDAFGNPYSEGLTLGTASGIQVLLKILSATQAALQFPTNNASEATAGNITGNVVGSALAQFLQLVLSGPKLNVAGHQDWAQIELNSANEGGTSSGNGGLEYIDTAAANHQYAFWDATGFNVLGSVIAVHPGASVASPAVPETWQPLGTGMGATWTVNETRYRMTPDGECEIDIAVNAQAGGGAAGVFTFANNLAAAYQFAGNYSRACPLTFNGTTAAGVNQPGLLVDGAGTSNPGRVRILVPALPATTNLGGTVRIPLS